MKKTVWKESECISITRENKTDGRYPTTIK